MRAGIIRLYLPNWKFIKTFDGERTETPFGVSVPNRGCPSNMKCLESPEACGCSLSNPRTIEICVQRTTGKKTLERTPLMYAQCVRLNPT